MRRNNLRTKAAHAGAATTLEAIPNIGPSLGRDLRRIGIKHPRELIGRDPLLLYQALCDCTRSRQDPCVLDTFISAVRFMEGATPRPWWHYTAERKKNFPLQPSALRRKQSLGGIATLHDNGVPKLDEFGKRKTSNV